MRVHIISGRKFRSETSDLWTDTARSVQRVRREIERERERERDRERYRKEEYQKKEDPRTRNTALPLFGGSGGCRKASFCSFQPVSQLVGQ